MHANLCKCECPAEELVLKIERYAQWLTQEYSKYREFSHDFTAAMHVGVPKQRNGGHDDVPN